jgi:hypothetical protein
MSYDYKTERAQLFTEDGQKLLLDIWDTAQHLLDKAGAFQADKVMVRPGSSWTMIACLDYLVETERLVEVTGTYNVFAQHRVFRSARRDA